MACGSFCASVCHPHLSPCISACLARWRSRDWWGPACQVCGLLSLIHYNSRGNPGSTQTSSAAAWSSFLSPPVTATLHIKISTIPLLELQRIQHTDWWERMRTKKKSSCCDKCPKACVCVAELTSKGHSVGENGSDGTPVPPLPPWIAVFQRVEKSLSLSGYASCLRNSSKWYKWQVWPCNKPTRYSPEQKSQRYLSPQREGGA